MGSIKNFVRRETDEDRLKNARSSKMASIEQSRKESESLGVTVNGVRYSGDPGNRQALTEALRFADESGLTVIPRWKDSDGGFHENHPVSDVREALEAIAQRRMTLISREGELFSAIEDSDSIESVMAVLWG